MHAHPLRLRPGADLRRELERAVGALPERAAFVLTGIGSLSQSNLRAAAADAPTLRVEPLEILTLAGTVTPQGAHLHATVSTASGLVFGGHVAEGCVVRTTAEVLLAVLPDWDLRRAHDPETGYLELAVERRADG